MLSGQILKYFSVDSAGNSEQVKSYDPSIGLVSETDPPPEMTINIDKKFTTITWLSNQPYAKVSGGSGDYEYRYTLRNPVTGVWSVAQAYSANPIWTWNTAGINAGTI